MKLVQLEKYIGYHLHGIIDACEKADYNLAMMHCMQLSSLLQSAIRYNSTLN